jgi:hypothetical protein
MYLIFVVESKHFLIRNMGLQMMYNRDRGSSGGRFLLLLMLFSMGSLYTVAQTSTLTMDKLAERINALALKSPIELVYLQTNKDIYESGEDLWFKAYVLDRHSFIPLASSKTLYLQLINEKSGLAVLSDKYEILNGFADGHAFLQDNLAEGDYILAAYTANSFYNDSTAHNAVCRIKVKKDVNPHISVTHDFNRFFYSPKDSIKVKCSVLTEYGEIPPYAEIQAELKRNDKKLGQAKVSTNAKGEAMVAFAPQKSGEGLKIDLKVKYSVKEELLSIPVPCMKGSPIQFELFPEGGNLVSELASRLAFKAVNIIGDPLDVEGTLFEDDNPVMDFKSTHAGMGSLLFIPNAEKKYRIRISKPKTDSVFQLPKVYPQGIVLYLAKRNDKFVELNVVQSKGLGKRTVYLRGQLRGVVYCMASGVLNDELKFRIPLSEFPYQGIAEFTLFDETLNPVAERLVYIKPDKKLFIETTLSKTKFETRDKASLKISVKDEEGKPVVANLGISVFDKIYNDPQNPKNILSYYLLTSQLKGKVYDPGYYLDTINQSRTEGFDLLLMTQGWRRYVWSEENMKASAVNKQLITDGIPGEVYPTKDKKRFYELDQIVKAFIPEKKEYSEMMLTDSTGRFDVRAKQLSQGKGGYVYLVPFGSVAFAPKIRLSDPFLRINEIRAKKVTDYPISRPPPVKKKEEQITFTGNHNAIKLPEVVIKGKGIRVFRDKYMGYLDSLERLKTNDYVCINHILNCSNHGINVDNTRPVEGVTYKTEIGVKTPGKKMTYRDEVYHYPQYTEEELMEMYNFSRVKGYCPKKEFYQPNYDKVSDENLIADYRNTLLWAPSVITDEKGEATVNFFCSDINFGFVGKVEGVSGDGLLGTKQFEFMVRKPVNQK